MAPTVKSQHPKYEEWDVKATHKHGHETIPGVAGKHSEDDYDYEKKGDDALRSKRLSPEQVANENMHSHNSGRRWFEVEGTEAEEAAAETGEEVPAPEKPKLPVKEKQPAQPKKED